MASNRRPASASNPLSNLHRPPPSLDDRLQQHLLAFSELASPASVPPPPSSSASTPNPPPSAAAAAATDPINLILEEVCRKEFGFELRELKQTLRLQADELQSSLLRFCEEVLNTHDPAQRREIAKNFIMGIAKISEIAAERSNRTLFQMQSTFLKNMQRESDMLRKELTKVQDKLTAALQISQLEKESIEANVRNRFEEEKDLLREELQSCRICLRNPRNVVIMPCLHAQYCEDCVDKHQTNHNTCPTCRGIIRGKLPYIA